MSIGMASFIAQEILADQYVSKYAQRVLAEAFLTATDELVKRRDADKTRENALRLFTRGREQEER
jgi:hypothetical protein